MRRNFGLNILRTFSTWVVLFQHMGIGILGLSHMKIGSIGVDFFVLSGLLIERISFLEIDKG